MARKARDAVPNGIYHIQQRSTDQRCLFESDSDRLRFLELLIETKQKYGIKLYAYCLEDKNAYHLIIHANGSDLTKLMKSLNISYAMYVKFEGPLFKDRYKSTLISTKCDFEKIKENILLSKSRGSQFNNDVSFCEDEDPFKAVCTECIKTKEEASEKIRQIAEIEKLNVMQLLSDKKRRNRLIVELRKTSLLSLKEIGELFGGISESTVSKILKSSL